MNVSDVLTSALGMLGVLREGESVSAEQGADGLKVFNDMLASWRESGIDLQIPNMPDTTTTFQLNDGDALTLKHQMAIHLSSYYPGRPLNPAIIAIGQQGYDRWLRNSINEELTGKKLRTISNGTPGYRSNILIGI